MFVLAAPSLEVNSFHESTPSPVRVPRIALLEKRGIVSDVDEPDQIAAHSHERAAERHRKAAERLRDAGLVKGEEAAKRVARDEETRAAEATDQPRQEP
jgi:hypothetical protein